MQFNTTYREWYAATVGHPRTGWIAPAITDGMVASLFTTDIEWRRTTNVSNIDILVSQAPFTTPPDVLWLVVATSAHEPPITVQLMGPLNSTDWVPTGPDGKPYSGTLIEPGGWFGVVTPTTTFATHLYSNVGPASFQILVNDARKLNWMYVGDHTLKSVKVGQRWRSEIFSWAADIRMNLQTVEQLLALREYLAAPEGLKVMAGSLVHRNGTLIEIKPDPIAKFALPPPTTSGSNVTGLMVPLRFGPFNPRWTIGVWQTSGYSKGLYGDGTNRWSTLGLDGDGFAYLPVYPSRADHTSAAVGCPFTMAGPGAESLFLQVTHVAEVPTQTWHVSISNPSLSESVTVQVKDTGMGLAGLELPLSRTVTVGPGQLIVLV